MKQANSLLDKLIVYIINKKHIYLVNVCAWCPEETYPQIHIWQKYTHGICKKHYEELSKHYQKPSLHRRLDRLIASVLPHLPLVQRYS